MGRGRAGRWCLAATTALGLAWHAHGARIAEPGTVLYGKVVQRIGADILPVAGGTLVWKLRTVGPGARELSFSTPVAPFGEAPAGPFGYRLVLPSELLAYDLAVRAGNLPLSSAAAKVEFVSVTLNGKPVTVAPVAATGFQVDQTRRAGVQRVDLSVEVIGQDSDGDGYPDDWEDANGYDKWDPFDSPKGGTGTGGTGGNGSLAKTFAEWRSAWFPGQAGDLDVFAEADTDGDGIPNLIEYAFALNPTKADGDTSRILPHPFSADGRQGLGYLRNPAATDLSFKVEASSDLNVWDDASARLETRAASQPDDKRTLLVEKTTEGEHPLQFFRVVVRRQ